MVSLNLKSSLMISCVEEVYCQNLYASQNQLKNPKLMAPTRFSVLYRYLCFNLQIVKNLNTVISTVLVKMFSCFHNAEMHPEDAYGVESKSVLL